MSEHRFAVVVTTPTGQVRRVDLYSTLHSAERAARRLRRSHRGWVKPPDVKVSVKNAGAVAP